jgi:hypothetical protein
MNDAEQLSDAELLLDARTRSEPFGAFYERHFSAVLAFFRRATMTRSAFVIVVAAAALAGSAVALAHNSPYSWTVAKARVMVQESTNIALPEADRVALDAELDAWRKKFATLVLIAQSEYARTVDIGADDPKYSLLAQTYDTYKRRFAAAQANVARGLSIDSVKCAGQGKTLTGKRYKHFHCSATSYVLEIPTVELVFGVDPFLPEVVEGPRKLIGPLPALFSLHVTGKSRMLSQRVS